MLALQLFAFAMSGLVVSAWLAVWLYGRFARKARGQPSFSLPITAPPTPVDRLVEPLTRAHREQTGLMLVEDNLDAFAMRALAARQAGRSLDLLYYMWKGDLSGRLLARELVTAADRGVRIRLLVDDLNAHRHDKTFLTLDSHPNIAVRLFNPTRNRDFGFRRGIEILLRAFSLTRRMHNKAWIADGQLAVVGGRNIGDDYFDAGGPTNFCDLDVLVLGPAMHQIEKVFDEYWNSAAALPIAALQPRPATGLSGLRRLLECVRESSQAQPYLDRVRRHGSLPILIAEGHRMHWTFKAEILSDPTEKAMGAREELWLLNSIRPVLASTSSKLDIISPYFVPRTAGTHLLLSLVQRGVTVRLLTNSLAATDVVAVHAAYARCRARLVAGGVNLFELKPYSTGRHSSVLGSSTASLHTKAFTIDGRVGFVGSMNFDPRSASLNCEMGIKFEQSGLIEEIRKIVADQVSPQKSYRLLLDNGKLGWEDASDGTERILRREPGASRWRRLSAAVIRFLPIESQL
jgi:cardiolipin synthase C